MGEVDKNEKWTTWKEIVQNLVTKDNCPPYHFAEDNCGSKITRRKCRKCCKKYVEENINDFS